MYHALNSDRSMRKKSILSLLKRREFDSFVGERARFATQQIKDKINNQLPSPGDPLRRATVKDTMLLYQNHPEVGVKSSKPPWNDEASATNLSKALEIYKLDLRHGRNSPGPRHGSDALPFLEDTITHLVGREQSALSRHARVPPSRVRAAAMRQALIGHGFNNRESRVGSRTIEKAEDLNEQRVYGDRLQSSLIHQANRIISVIAVIEHLIPLTIDQKLSISNAVVYGPNVHPAKESCDFGIINQNSAWKAVHSLLGDCYLNGKDAAEILARYPRIATTEMVNSNSIRGVVDCLQLLELSNESVSNIVSGYPEILFLDVDKHMLPILAYLSDLGLDDSDIVDIIVSHPGIFKPGNASNLQAGVAFWTGKSLPRSEIINLIKADPTIFETNKWVMQMKVDWLTEQTKMPIEYFSSEARALSCNLGSMVGPRIAYALHFGIQFPPDDREKLSHQLKMIMSPDVEEYLQFLGSSQESFQLFSDVWYSEEFLPWLERKSRASEILLQQENESENGMDSGQADQNFAASKEFAWEQQIEREREWHMAWHAWKREQQSAAVADRSARRSEKRKKIEDMRLNFQYAKQIHASETHHEHKSTSSSATGKSFAGEEGALNFLANSTPLIHGNSSKLMGSDLSDRNQRSVIFLSRKWICDSTIDEALAQAMLDSNQELELKTDFEVNDISSLTKERVQSCAVNLLLLLRASEFCVLEPKVFSAWAARSGVTPAELTVAKAMISSSNAAVVRSEPSWKYYGVPLKVWRLKDSPFYAPDLLPLRDTRGSRNVSDLAEVIYRSLKENPNTPMTRMEISELCDDRIECQSKRMRFAVGLLLEQGLVLQRRRKGIASGPMELILTESLFDM